MIMSRLSSLKYVFIVHRSMGCDDESATDEEQAEKILYYYPESESLNDQLNKINMVEGLIDFATKFSVDAISTVVMQQNTWAFYECEKNIWVIAAVDSQSLNSSSLDEFTHNHQSNTYALEASLRSLYSMYFTTHGALQLQLGSGLGDAIQGVKTLRKQIRKLRLRLRQEMQDLQSLVNREKEALEAKEDNGTETESAPVEHMGIRANTKTILQVQTEIDQSNAEIDALSMTLHDALRSPLYTPVNVRRSVAAFMRFYLASGELDSTTCLAGMKGLRVLQTGYLDPVVTTVNNCTINTATNVNTSNNTSSTSLSGPYSASVHYHHTLNTSTASSGVGQSILSGHTTLSGGGSAFSSTVLRIRSVLEQATAHQAIGSVMLYDGRLLWSDLDNQTTLCLTDFVTLQDTQYVRNAAVAMINNPGSVTDTKYMGAGGSSTGYFKKSYNSDADLEAAVSKKLLQLLNLRGFVTRQWGTLNLEEAQINPLLLDAKNETLPDVSDHNASIGGAGALNADVTEEASLNGSGIYCPRIYTQCADVGVNGPAHSGCIGRAVFYRHNRTMIVILLKDWEVHSDADLTAAATISLDFKRPAIEHILRDVHSNNRHTRNMYGTDFVELMNKHELNDYYGTTMYSNASNASSVNSNVDVLSSEKGVASPITAATTTTTTHIAAESATPSNVVPLSSACIDNACLVGLCCCVQLQASADLVKLEKAFKNITYSDETGAILKNSLLNGYADGSLGSSNSNASSSSNNLNSLGGSGAANSISTAVAYERIASAITIAEELQLGYTRPELPLSPVLKNTRFVYYNPIDCSLKVCGINSQDLSPLLCSPKHFREFIISNLAATTAIASTSSKQYVPLSQQNSTNGSNGNNGNSKNKKVCGAVIDKLSDRGGFKFLANSSLLAECLEPPVVRALNDIWIQLAGRELLHSTTLSHTTASVGTTSTANVCTATAVHEACLRVSTPQRGGVWVTGRNIGGRFLYMIIDKCVTMNDMYHAFEQLSELLVR